MHSVCGAALFRGLSSEPVPGATMIYLPVAVAPLLEMAGPQAAARSLGSSGPCRKEPRAPDSGSTMLNWGWLTADPLTLGHL